MALTLLHSGMFDVGDLPVLTFGNCVLKTSVIKWPLKLCNGTAVVKFGHRHRKACRRPDAANIPSSPKLRQRSAVSDAMGRKLSYSFSWLFR